MLFLEVKPRVDVFSSIQLLLHCSCLHQSHGRSNEYVVLLNSMQFVCLTGCLMFSVPWSSGRVDALDPSAVTPDGRLPNADSGPPGADPDDAAHLRMIFNRMGFNDQEIVALSGTSRFYCSFSRFSQMQCLSRCSTGAYALGRCHP